MFDTPLSDEASRLQRCVDDLTSILATMSKSTADTTQVGQNLADTLVSMIQVDFVYVHLADPSRGAPREFASSAASFGITRSARDLGAALAETLGPTPAMWPASGHLRMGETIIPIAVKHFGTRGDLGTVAAGSRQSGFPEVTDNLVLGVAASQTALALHELHRRVADDDASRRQALLQKSEARLAAAERETRSTLDSLPTIAWRGNARGYVMALNQSWFDYTGTTPAQMRGRGWKSCVHPDDIDNLVEIGRQYVSAGVPIDGEARLRRRDGEYRWFLFRPALARDSAGNILGWNGSVIDIEDRKRAEQAVAASEYNLQTMIDTMPALAWSALPDGTVLFANKHYQDFVGLSLGQLQGFGWTTAVHPDDLVELTMAWQSMVSSGQGGEIEARFRRHDGEYRRLIFRTNPLRDEDGRVVRWYGVNTDIEDRKRAEERLRRSEASLVAGQRVSRTGTFTWQLDTDELVFSEELYRIFEFEPTSAVTFELVAARFHPEDVSALSDRMKLVRAGHTPSDQELRLRMPDGRIKHLRSVGQMVVREDGQPEYLGAIQDVTERRLAEEARDKTRSELAHVTRIMSLSAVTASIAHEVNQPLAGIVTNASTCLRMLATDPQNIEGAREAARRLIRDGNRAADVISRLRDLFSGKKSISRESLDLRTAAREVLSVMSADLLRNSISLTAQIDGDRPLLVKGDRVQLQQVILNLVRNAVDAMKETQNRPRLLLVGADIDEEGRARIYVNDTGVGFDQQGTDRLFDAFYTTKGDGMGIGLSVSRSIIESHGGILQAVPNDAHGATFFFAIPQEDTRDVAPGATDTTKNASAEKLA
jgi:PAS domain S-box-containing protein